MTGRPSAAPPYSLVVIGDPARAKRLTLSDPHGEDRVLAAAVRDRALLRV